MDRFAGRRLRCAGEPRRGPRAHRPGIHHSRSAHRRLRRGVRAVGGVRLRAGPQPARSGPPPRSEPRGFSARPGRARHRPNQRPARIDLPSRRADRSHACELRRLPHRAPEDPRRRGPRPAGLPAAHRLAARAPALGRPPGGAGQLLEVARRGVRLRRAVHHGERRRGASSTHRAGAPVDSRDRRLPVGAPARFARAPRGRGGAALQRRADPGASRSPRSRSSSAWSSPSSPRATSAGSSTRSSGGRRPNGRTGATSSGCRRGW